MVKVRIRFQLIIISEWEGCLSSGEKQKIWVQVVNLFLECFVKPKICDFFFLLPPVLLKSDAELVEITGDFTVEFSGYWIRPHSQQWKKDFIFWYWTFFSRKSVWALMTDLLNAISMQIPLRNNASTYQYARPSDLVLKANHNKYTYDLWVIKATKRFLNGDWFSFGTRWIQWTVMVISLSFGSALGDESHQSKCRRLHLSHSLP